MSAVACPICGAQGDQQCATRSGRDHRARFKAEEAGRAAARPARERESRPWDAAAVQRVMRAEGRRVGRNGTEVDLAELARVVREEGEAAIIDAVIGLRQREATWGAIGEAFGVSRSAAFQRYGKHEQPLE